MEKGIGYARISTNSEKQNINQQIDYIKRFAAEKQIELSRIFKDIKTGKTDDRAGYKNMLKFLKENPACVLVVQDTDRLTRNFYDAVEFEKQALGLNLKIYSASENIDLNSPNGRFMFRIKMAMNSFYVENLLQKIRVGVERAKKEGLFTGRKHLTKEQVRQVARN